jgi:hypothetical protein
MSAVRLNTRTPWQASPLFRNTFSRGSPQVTKDASIVPELADMSAKKKLIDITIFGLSIIFLRESMP